VRKKLQLRRKFLLIKQWLKFQDMHNDDGGEPYTCRGAFQGSVAVLFFTDAPQAHISPWLVMYAFIVVFILLKGMQVDFVDP
jgi:hypothetical protein